MQYVIKWWPQSLGIRITSLDHAVGFAAYPRKPVPTRSAAVKFFPHIVSSLSIWHNHITSISFIVCFEMQRILLVVSSRAAEK